MVEGHGRGAGGGLPRDHPADLYRAPVAAQLGLCELERAEPLAAALRPIYTAASAEAAAAALDAFERGPWDPISHGGRGVAPGVDPRHPVLCLPARDPARALHHERARERQRRLRKILRRVAFPAR